MESRPWSEIARERLDAVEAWEREIWQWIVEREVPYGHALLVGDLLPED